MSRGGEVFKGCGLSLSGADYVIVYNPTWNSSSPGGPDEIKRFRVGQSRDVKVFRLVAEGTVEEMFYLRRVYKHKLKSMSLKSSWSESEGKVSKNSDSLFDYCNIWLLRKEENEDSLSQILLKKEYCQEAGVMAVQDVAMEMGACQIPSGGYSLSVEDQADKSSLSPQTQSQETRTKNLISTSQLQTQQTTRAGDEHISDESDDIDSYQPKKQKDNLSLDPSPPKATLESLSPSPAQTSNNGDQKALSSKTGKHKLQSSKELMKGKGTRGTSRETMKARKPPAGKSRAASASKRLHKRSVARSKASGKGLLFEDENDEISMTEEMGKRNDRSSSSSVAAMPIAESTQTFQASSKPSASSSPCPVSSYGGSTQPSLYSYAEHEMMDELFGEQDSRLTPDTANQTVLAYATAAVSDTVLLDDDIHSDESKSTPVRCTSEAALMKSTTIPGVNYSDVGLCSPSVDQDVGTTQKTLASDADKMSSCSSLTVLAECPATVVEQSTLTKTIPAATTVSTAKTFSKVSEFNIDDLFGF